MKIGICIGHSREGDNGAIAADDVTSEWHFWHAIGYLIKKAIPACEHDVRVFESYAGRSYTEAMTDIARQLREMGADLAIELHFNAWNAKASGYEVLHWHKSRMGRLFAQALNKAQADTLNEWGMPFPNRGVKPIGVSGRGSQFLRKTHCPAVIWEPFFGDNPDEWFWYDQNDTQLVGMVLSAIEIYNE